MDGRPKYFTLSLESLRVIGGWAADCAERAQSATDAETLSPGTRQPRWQNI